MKTEAEVRAKIEQVKKDYDHVLKGKLATIFENAPRALMQIDACTQLQVLHWTLGEEFKHTFEGE